MTDLSFELSLENVYESEVDANTKDNNFKYRVAIFWACSLDETISTKLYLMSLRFYYLLH